MIALREKESLVRGSQVKRAVNVCVSCMFGEVLMKHVDSVLQVLPSVILQSFFSHFLGWLKKKSRDRAADAEEVDHCRPRQSPKVLERLNTVSSNLAARFEEANLERQCPHGAVLNSFRSELVRSTGHEGLMF